MHLSYKQLIAYKGTIGIGKVGFAVAYGFYLGARKHQAGHIFVYKKIFERRLFILDINYMLLFHRTQVLYSNPLSGSKSQKVHPTWAH